MTDKYMVAIRYVVKKDGKYLRRKASSWFVWEETLDKAQLYIRREIAELGAHLYNGQVVEIQIMEVVEVDDED